MLKCKKKITRPVCTAKFYRCPTSCRRHALSWVSRGSPTEAPCSVGGVGSGWLPWGGEPHQKCRLWVDFLIGLGPSKSGAWYNMSLLRTLDMEGREVWDAPMTTTAAGTTSTTWVSFGLCSADCSALALSSFLLFRFSMYFQRYHKRTTSLNLSQKW